VGFIPLKKIAELSNAGTLIAFVAVCASMIILRLRKPRLERRFKTPLFWLTGPVAIIGCAFIFSSLPVQSQMFTLIWMVIGLCVYGAYGVRHSRLRRTARETAKAAA
jgi:APA family basic amino acid/polyamine antiporter